ncbi:TPA: hypothetical protein N0F65_010498 [Lagenidium giganteum]|uniref:Sugar phosphate transporter domain-containing protein n=1 Tax=Lagenidium giganteum TaxID=4803 RepID=A0AAV2ZBU5_9STRA|nr:TPA: hypothetical protein N0F65_010498 [Lagenidium giganteum]
MPDVAPGPRPRAHTGSGGGDHHGASTIEVTTSPTENMDNDTQKLLQKKYKVANLASAAIDKMKGESGGHDTVLTVLPEDKLGKEALSASSSSSSSGGNASKTTYVAPSTVVFWLSMWFVQNIGVTFWNKKALTAIRLPVTLTLVHMVCNSIGAFAYIHLYKGVERKPLNASQKRLMAYFSVIFVSNIVTGNWSLGLVSISFNQVMRALVPGIVVGLSMLILAKTYSKKRMLSLVPVAVGVYLACSGDNSCTFVGFIITLVAVIFAGLKAVLSSKFLTGDLKLHPVDLILHQAPLSALWCLVAMLFTDEWSKLSANWEQLPTLSTWYIITGIVSFLLNVTSFQANKVTSAVTLCVCGNMKQIIVIALSIWVNQEDFGTQKAIGTVIVTLGGIAYAYISTKEMNQGVPIRPQTRA